MAVTKTITANPQQPTTVEDNDSISKTITHTEDNLDGDVTIHINHVNPARECRPCPQPVKFCADNGFRDFHYYGHGHRGCHDHSCDSGSHMNQPVTVNVKKSNNTYNFGAAFVPAGYFNNQGGGQGATVTGGQQTIQPPASPPRDCGCSDEGGSDSGGGGTPDPAISNRVTNETFNTFNNTYNNEATNTDANIQQGNYPVAQPGDATVNDVIVDSGAGA